MLQEPYQLNDAAIAYMIYWMGLAPDAFQHIEKKTKCKDLSLQLSAFRGFVEEYRDPYTPFR